MAPKTKETIPLAFTGGILAGITVLMGIPGLLPPPFALNMPPWAVFITWAGYFAAGGGGKGQALGTAKKMYFAIPFGAFWGLVAGLGFMYINPLLPNIGTILLVDGIIIFLVNQPILWGTKYFGPLKHTPAMFYGFATFFGTFFGGFGFLPGNIFAAFISGVIANWMGPLWGTLQVRFAMIKEVAE
jgi:hypothetical protein